MGEEESRQVPDPKEHFWPLFPMHGHAKIIVMWILETWLLPCKRTLSILHILCNKNMFTIAGMNFLMKKDTAYYVEDCQTDRLMGCPVIFIFLCVVKLGVFLSSYKNYRLDYLSARFCLEHGSVLNNLHSFETAKHQWTLLHI